MKKYISIFVSICLLFTFTMSTTAKSKDDSKPLNVHEKGVMEVADTTFDIISETETTSKMKIKEKDGIDAKASFSITANIFKGVIDSNSESYNLEGTRVTEENSLYFYRGIVNNDENQKFEAMLVEDQKNKGKYNALINISWYTPENSEEPAKEVTFSFNNHSSKYKEKLVDVPKEKVKKDKTGSGDFTTAAYYEFLTGYYSYYIETMVSGPKKTIVGSGDNHSVRSTTKSTRIDQYWRDQGYSTYGTKVAEFDNHFTGASYSVYNAVDPSASSEKSYSAPIYIPGYIGTQFIPVTLSTVSISNNGTSTLKYDFSWGYTNTGGYVDDSGVDKKPSSNGHVVRAFWDTSYNMSKGWKTNKVSSSFLYRTKCITLTSGGFFYVTKRATNNVSYLIEVI